MKLRTLAALAAISIIAAELARPLFAGGGNQITDFQTTNVKEVVSTPPCLAGAFTTNGPIQADWNPTCTNGGSFANHSLILIQAGDNNGSIVTGLAAVANSLPVGSERTICDVNGTADDGSITFPIEDPSSVASNRFWIDNNGASVFTDRLRLATGSCITFVYEQPVQVDPTVFRWVPKQTVVASYHSKIQNLEVWPRMLITNITGTNNDWGPDTNCTPPLGSVLPQCEAGGSGLFVDSSFVVVTTLDATGATITGMTGPGGNSGKNEGQFKWITNGGPGVVTITNQDGGSLAANRFLLPNTTSITIPVNETRAFYTNGSGWILVGTGIVSTATTANALIKVGANANQHVASLVIDNGTATTIGAVNIQDSISQNTAAGFITVVPSGTGLTSNAGNDISVLDNRTFNTTAGGITVSGFASVVGATRSAGANPLTGIASTFQCTGATTCYARQSTGGSIYDGLGPATPVDYHNSSDFDVSAVGKIETTVYTGGGDFTGTTRQQLQPCGTAPTVNVGTLSTDSNNCYGTITAIGANTSFTLTYGATGFATLSRCWFTFHGATAAVITNSTPSKTAPVFSCFDMAGAPLNCPDLDYQCQGH